MTDCDSQLLSAYLDDELPPSERARLDEHLSRCPGCAAELEHLRESSTLLRSYPFDDLHTDELRRVHIAIEQANDQTVWRLGGILIALAASVLIVSSAWLMEVPGTAPVSVGSQTLASTAPPPWEQMAMTLRAEPLPFEIDPSTGGNQTQLADAQFAQWMLDSLSQ